MAELVPKLHHLRPPAGGGRFQLHRFSPYFDHPEEYGIRWTGAHPMFRHAFPVPQDDLDELVYLHEFALAAGDAGAVDCSALDAAVAGWRRAYRQGASLRIAGRPDGSSLIEDRRRIGSPPANHTLSAAETALYRFLDGGVGDKAVAERFRRAHPDAAAALDRHGGVAAAVGRWLRHDLALAIDGHVVALALPAERSAASAWNRRAESAEGLPYGDLAVAADAAVTASV
jgi:hypothetical protein